MENIFKDIRYGLRSLLKRPGFTAIAVMLAIAGGPLALFLATFAVDLVLKLAPAGLPRLEQVGIDARVLGWTTFVSVLSGLILGLGPAWQRFLFFRVASCCFVDRLCFEKNRFSFTPRL